jgi:hypothetical protein
LNASSSPSRVTAVLPGVGETEGVVGVVMRGRRERCGAGEVDREPRGSRKRPRMTRRREHPQVRLMPAAMATASVTPA